MKGVILRAFSVPINAEFGLRYRFPETTVVMLLTFSRITRWGGKRALKFMVSIFLGFKQEP
jgi:TctA family transporter